MCVVIEPDSSLRTGFATMLTELGCAAVASQDGADIAVLVQRFEPAIVFLDVGRNLASASGILRTLSLLGYHGPIQIISERPGDWRLGAHLGLDLLEPIKAPAGKTAIQAVLASEGLLTRPADSQGQNVSAALVYRPWYRTTSPTPGLFDVRLAGSEVPLPPHRAIQYWRDQETAAHDRLRGLGAPSAFVVNFGLADLSTLVAAVGHASDTADLVLSIAEEEIFRNVDAARTSLAALHELGVAIRVTGCGTRFFAMAGHRPLPVDQVVIDTFLRKDCDSSALKKYWVITDIIRRAGATIFTECPSPPRWLAAAGVDFCTSSQAGWCKVPASEPPIPGHQTGNWRKVGLCELTRPCCTTSFRAPFGPRPVAW